MIIKTYNSAGGADYSNLSTFETYLQGLADEDLDEDRTVVLKVEEGVHATSQQLILNGFAASGINLIISGEVPLNPSGPGNGAVFRKEAANTLINFFDGSSISSITFENIEHDLVNSYANYRTHVLYDGNTLGLDRIYTFKNCRFLNLSSAPTTNHTIRLSPDMDASSHVATINIENCIFHDYDNTTTQGYATMFQPTDGVLNFNYRGVITPDGTARIMEGSTWGRSTAVVNISYEGCIFSGQPSLAAAGPGVENVSAIDCISDNTCWDSTAISKTNVSGSITINLSGAPAANEVSFSGGQNGDFRLYNDPNNLALGFVSNSTPVSPDFAGNDRGTSPYDAGALEFVSGGTTDVTAAFGNVYVRLY